jgi:hypothetical protein
MKTKTVVVEEKKVVFHELKFTVGDHVSVETNKRCWTGTIEGYSQCASGNTYQIIPDIGLVPKWVSENDVRVFDPIQSVCGGEAEPPSGESLY